MAKRNQSITVAEINVLYDSMKESYSKMINFAYTCISWNSTWKRATGDYHSMMNALLDDYNNCCEHYDACFENKQPITDIEFSQLKKTTDYIDEIVGDMDYVVGHMRRQFKQIRKEHTAELLPKTDAIKTLIECIAASADKQFVYEDWHYELTKKAELIRCRGWNKISNSRWLSYEPDMPVDLTAFGHRGESYIINEETADRFKEEWNAIDPPQCQE
jgi:hypothetical protein